MWFSFEIGDGLIAAYRVVPDGGEIVPVELRLLKRDISPGTAPFIDGPEPDDLFDTRSPLSGKIVRTLSFGKHLEEIREILQADDQAESVSEFYARAFGFVSVLLHDPVGRTTRRRLGEMFYLGIAVLYVKAVRAESKHPAKDVATHLEEKEGLFYDRKSVYNLIGETRRRGYLPPAPASGMAGGELTDKALEILRRLSEDASPNEPS